VGLGGSLAGSEVLEVTVARGLPESLNANIAFSATASLHQFDATQGYDTRPYGGLRLRVDLGAAVIRAPSTVIELAGREHSVAAPKKSNRRFSHWAKTGD